MQHKKDIKKHYKIGKSIGRGGFSRVKWAKNRQTGQLVAVKVFSFKKMNKNEINDLQSEIEIMKKFSHPNIVKLIDVYEDKEYCCLVMELLEGGNLFEYISEFKDLMYAYKTKEIQSIILNIKNDFAQRVVMELIAALKYSHE